MSNDIPKHAFLIIAHNEFEVLQKLIDALDNERNDIYVHIDAKVKKIPTLKVFHSQLNILKNRICVIWGDVAQIACEIRLMEEAVFSGNRYIFYHIISGTHYPLVSNQYIFDYFDLYKGKSILQAIEESSDDAQMRIGRYHYFLSYFNSKWAVVRKISRILWVSLLSIQKILGIERDISYNGGKASNWCSLSEEAVKAVLADKKRILQRFSRTFCADELFVPSVLKEHNLPFIYSNQLLYVDFIRYTPTILTGENYDKLMASKCLFARKMTSESMELINKISNGKN